MAKIDIAEEKGEKVVAPKGGDRQARFDAHVAKYAVSNPVKYASKKKNGEFDKIPDSFK